MKVLLLLVPLLGSGVSLNVARSRSTSDPCATSPCAQNAICETSPAGLAFCRCRPGHTGDPFVMCETQRAGNIGSGPSVSVSTHSQASTPSHPFVHVVPQIDVVRPPQHPTKFTVEYHTSTDQMDDRDRDLSRVPILGDVSQPNVPNRNRNPASSPSHNRIHESHPHSHSFSGSGPIVHETTVVSGNVQRHHVHQQNQFIPSHVTQINSNSIVADPMGEYKNCRNINGVIVCADTRVDPGTAANANPSQSSHQENRKTHVPIPVVSTPTLDQGLNMNVPSTNVDVCRSACGINAMCRSINGRAVCGCPADHTGDPGLRCDPLAKEEESVCQKHIECDQTEICHEGKCLDPCTLDKHQSVCGTNARCVVVQHTPVCGCQQGFVGNPYEGCVI